MGNDRFSITIMVVATVALVAKGAFSFFSTSPVGFGNDEKYLKASELTDVKKWNRSHAMLWFGYAIAVLIGYGCELLLGDRIWATLPFFVGVFVPIPIMMKLHKKYVALYKK